MTDYPDTITVTPESIEFGFGADGERLALQIVAACPPPIGVLRLNLAPGQAGTLYATLDRFATLTDEQTRELVDTINNATRKG